MDNINFNQKKKEYSFVSVKEPAWHRLGKTVPNVMTSKEAIELANLDYVIGKSRVAVHFPEHITERSAKYIPNVYATYREDTLDVFGVVSSDYEVTQNTDAFRVIDSIVGEGKAVYETAGALGKGEVVFITAKLPYHIKVAGNDVIENYLVVSTGHDGKTGFKVFFTPIRVVCNNTLSLGIRTAKTMLKFRHTSSIHDNIDDVGELLQITSSIASDMEDTLKQLANMNINDAQYTQYVNSLFLNPDELKQLEVEEITYDKCSAISTNKKNIITNIHEYYNGGIGQSNIIGTAYGAYNSINGYLSNVKKYSSEDKKMQSLVMGGRDHGINMRALELALIIGD